MEVLRENLALPRPPETGRWVFCVALALGVHVAAAAALLAHWNATPDEVANAPLIMIDLKPLPVAPEVKPTEVPPGPLQRQAAAAPAMTKPAESPKPIEKAAEARSVPKQAEAQTSPPLRQTADITSTLPPPPQAELVTVVLPPKPPEKSADKAAESRRRRARAHLASAPSPAEKRAARAAASAPGASSQNPNAVPNWKSELVARLERYKHYPAEAQARGEHGVTQLAFSVDRRGGVHHPHISRSSGSSNLDAATMALIERAAPMPPPPPELAGAQIAISVPIHYDMR